jgi:hypothetical protein
MFLTDGEHMPWADQDATERLGADYIADKYRERMMKPINDLMALFLSKKDEMAALSRLYGAPEIDVACVMEAVAEWHHDIMKEIGR